jgi:hypothetical protein
MKSGTIREPEKELRFTRARQAVWFWLLAAVCGSAALTLLLAAFYRDVNPALPHGVWAVVPGCAALAAARLAVHLTRHAYVILTPLGIEIFPFFKPADEMRMVLWQEIDSAEVDTSLTCLTLHQDADRTTGLHLTLRPVPEERRELLARAVLGRLRERRSGDETGEIQQTSGNVEAGETVETVQAGEAIAVVQA